MIKNAQFILVVLAAALVGCSTADSGGAHVGGFESTSPKSDQIDGIHHYDVYHDVHRNAVTYVGENIEGVIKLELEISTSEEGPIEVETRIPEPGRAVIDRDLGEVVEGEIPDRAIPLIEQAAADFAEAADGSGKADENFTPLCYVACGAAVISVLIGSPLLAAVNGAACGYWIYSGQCNPD